MPAETRIATRLVEQGPPAPPPGPKLWLLGGFAVLTLAAGTLAGATVLGPGADAGAGTGSNGDATAPSTAAAPPIVGPVFDCPGGAEVGRLRAGDRVYVVGRDESGTWSAIRNPGHIADVVWVEGAALDPDTDIEVDVMQCDEPIALSPPGDTPVSSAPTTAAPGSPTTLPSAPSTTVAGAPGTGSPVTTTTSVTTTTAAPDTQAPTLQVSASRTEIFRDDGLCQNSRTSLLTVTATDDVGVTTVTGSYAGLPGSPLQFTRTNGSAASGTWAATFGPFAGPSSQDVTITVTARDANGNSRDFPVTIKYWAMGCLG